MFTFTVRRLQLYLQSLHWRSGQGLVEYALLLIMVAVAMMALILILGPGLANTYANIVASM